MLDHVTDNDVFMIETSTGMLSTGMGQKEIDKLSEIALDGFKYPKAVCNLCRCDD